MTADEAVIILIRLLNGIDPETGEVLSPDHTCREATVIDALQTGIVALCNAGLPYDAPENTQPLRNRNGRLNAGRPWTEEDNEALKSLWEQGNTIEEICAKTERRARGVRNQLICLRLAPTDLPLPRRKPRPPRPAGQESTGSRWTPQEDEQLTAMFREKTAIPQIAKALHRSQLSIHYRLIYLGLIAP